MAEFVLTETPLLSRSTLDRAEALRSDEALLRQHWPQARLLQVTKGGRARIVNDSLHLGDAHELGPEPPPEAVFLGIVGGRHVWGVFTPELDGELSDLRRMGARLSDIEAGLLTTAVGLLSWHHNARFSAVDGTRTRTANAGWSRVSEQGHEEFPRTDPATICLVHDGADRVLLARQHAWPSTTFSILAGFVESGESLERCVAREVLEEVGLHVRDVRYLGSQPWPFPRSLMLGFSAIADPAEPLQFHDGEIAEAYWFTRDEVRAALAAGDWTKAADSGYRGRLLLPGSVSIARGILTSWADAG